MTAKHCFEVLSRLGLEPFELHGRQAIRMDPLEAYAYSAITGSGYIENRFHPFSVRPYMKILGSALSFEPIEGMFTKEGGWETPRQLARKRPYLLRGPKYLLFVEIDSEDTYFEVLSEAMSYDLPLGSILLQRVEVQKQGDGLEPFYEYVFGVALARIGFVVENQFPLNATTGSPDLVGVSASALPELGGMLFANLSFPETWPDADISRRAVKEWPQSVVVGEVKTSTKVMAKQMEKYLKTGFFDNGLEIHPSSRVPSVEGLGMGWVSASGEVSMDIDLETDRFASARQRQFLEWVIRYTQIRIVGSLTRDEFAHITSISAPNFGDILEWTKRRTLAETIEEVGDLHRGTVE